jgi:hypothetical protein
VKGMSFSGWESYVDNLLNELTPWCKLPHRAVGNPPRSLSESSQCRSQVQHHLPCVVTLGRKSKILWPLWYHLLYQSRGGTIDSRHQDQQSRVDYSVGPNATSCLTLVLEGLPKVSDIATGFHSLTQSFMFV